MAKTLTEDWILNLELVDFGERFREKNVMGLFTCIGEEKCTVVNIFEEEEISDGEMLFYTRHNNYKLSGIFKFKK